MTSKEGKVQPLPLIGLMICLFLAENSANVSFAQETSVAPLTADQIVQTMVKRTSNAPKSWRVTVGPAPIILNITDCPVRAPRWLWR